MNIEVSALTNLANDAYQAIIESQANNDPVHFQHAQLLLQKVKQQLNEALHQQYNSQDANQLQHVKDLVRRLEETHDAIEAID